MSATPNTTSNSAPSPSAALADDAAVHLRRLRWAVRAALTLGVAASVAANVLHARPNPISQVIAAWPPLALLLTVELISRVPHHRRSLGVIRIAATAVIAAIATWVSYSHLVGVAARYGETEAGAAYLLPISVDGSSSSPASASSRSPPRSAPPPPHHPRRQPRPTLPQSPQPPTTPQPPIAPQTQATGTLTTPPHSPPPRAPSIRSRRPPRTAPPSSSRRIRPRTKTRTAGPILSTGTFWAAQRPPPTWCASRRRAPSQTAAARRTRQRRG
ncbi:DUF2637 domain-containing protein [Micromonospora sp. 4G55]|uniref:DUF2637 domain-containing protein n=1 Tax=Micromonospora sp. 4G55 TaxID=2806102 RepID=UPI001EE49ADD|nr:DUF2637 domain-containing protein [Micromonospora sp. 4G55]